MKTYFPITHAISRDAEIITHALDKRAEEIKNINSQSLCRRLTILALQVIGLAAGLLTLACLPLAAIMFTITAFPLKVAGISLILALTCLGLGILLSPTTPGEIIIKNKWRGLFSSLRQGDGALIIQSCQELAIQKEQRRDSFNRCLGPLSPDETSPFFHKACLVGYLLLAIQHLRRGEKEQANSKAQSALSHFPGSEFPDEVRHFVKRFGEAPQSMMQDLTTFHSSQYPLHSLDQILVTKMLIK